MDFFGVPGEGGELAGNPVVETHADADQQIGMGDGVIGVAGAVHPQHAQGKIVVLGKATDAHKRRRHRNLHQFGQRHELLLRPGGDDAAADVENRLLRGGDGFGRGADLLLVTFQGRLVAGKVHPARGFVIKLGVLHVHGDIDEDRSRPPRGGDVERLLENPGDVLRFLDQVTVFDDRLGDAGDVDFLEGVGADEVAAHLAGDGDHRRRIQIGVGDAGDQVGGPGAAGGDTDAGLAGCPGIAVGGVGRALLVAHQVMLQA